MSRSWYEARRGYPLVRTAAEFAKYLTDVGRRAGGWDYYADAPCHTSSSGRSFVFKDGRMGGVDVHCFSCFGVGGWLDKRTFADTIEDALGIRLNVEYADGRTRWAGRSLRGRGLVMAKAVASGKRNAEVGRRLVRDGFTLRDLLNSRVWIPTVITDANARIPLEFRHTDGRRYAFAQSHKDRLEWCQFGSGEQTIERVGRGGVVRRVHMLGWDTAKACIEKGERYGARAIGLCMSGVEGTPSLTDVGVLDFDYKITGNAEVDEGNARWRSGVWTWLKGRGCVMSPSRSGRGFHALFRQREEDDEKWLWKANIAAILPPKREGAGIDLFPAGDRRPVNIVWEKITAEMLGQVIPFLSYDEIGDAWKPKEGEAYTGECGLCGREGELENGKGWCVDREVCVERALERMSEERGERTTGECGYCGRLNQSLIDSVCEDRDRCFAPMTYGSPDDIDAIFLYYFKSVVPREGQTLKGAILERWMEDGKPMVRVEKGRVKVVARR